MFSNSYFTKRALRRLPKIDVILHGIPDIPSIDPNFNKDQFGVEGKPCS
jgi:hypothetical protein